MYGAAGALRCQGFCSKGDFMDFMEEVYMWIKLKFYTLDMYNTIYFQIINIAPFPWQLLIFY